jgi:hypothetical protein
MLINVTEVFPSWWAQVQPHHGPPAEAEADALFNHAFALGPWLRYILRYGIPVRLGPGAERPYANSYTCGVYGGRAWGGGEAEGGALCLVRRRSCASRRASACCSGARPTTPTTACAGTCSSTPGSPEVRTDRLTLGGERTERRLLALSRGPRARSLWLTDFDGACPDSFLKAVESHLAPLGSY